MNKITKLEKEELINLKIEKIDSNEQYAFQIFKTYYKDNPKDNLKDWKQFDDKQKKKIVKQITKFEDDAFIQQGKLIYGMKVNKIMDFVKECKHKQLVEFGIRK